MQEILAYSFEISQSEANNLIHKLSSILTDALTQLDCMPQKTAEKILEKLKEENPQNYAMDGTERRIIRPHDPDIEPIFYSGKKNAIR